MLSTREKEKLTAEQEKFNKKINQERFKELFLTLQFFALIVSTGLYIASFFMPNLRIIAKIVIGVLLLIMAYNNKTYIKRKYATIIYILASIFFIISGLIGVFA